MCNTFSQTRLQLPSKRSSREISLSNQLAASRQETKRLLQEQEDREEAAEVTAQHERAAHEQTRKHNKETAVTDRLCRQAVARAEEKRTSDAAAAAERQRQAVAEAHRKGRAAVDAQDLLDSAEISRVNGKYERAAIQASTMAMEEEALRVSEHQELMDEVQLEVEEQSRSARDKRRTLQDAHAQKMVDCKQTGIDNTKTSADLHSLALEQLIGSLASDRAAQTSRESEELAALEASARADVGAAAARYDTDCSAGKAALERLKQEGQSSGEAMRQHFHRMLDAQNKRHLEADKQAKDVFAYNWAQKEASHQQQKDAQVQTFQSETMQVLRVKHDDLAAHMLATRHAHLVEVRTGNLIMYNTLEAQPHLLPSQRQHVMRHLYECQAKLEAEINPNAPPSQLLLLTHTIHTPPTQVPNVSADQGTKAGEESWQDLQCLSTIMPLVSFDSLWNLGVEGLHLFLKSLGMQSDSCYPTYQFHNHCCSCVCCIAKALEFAFMTELKSVPKVAALIVKFQEAILRLMCHQHTFTIRSVRILQHPISRTHTRLAVQGVLAIFTADKVWLWLDQEVRCKLCSVYFEGTCALAMGSELQSAWVWTHNLCLYHDI